MTVERLTSTIRDVPDFPKKGIIFKDITTLLKDPASFALALDEMMKPLAKKTVNMVVGIESRGFIFGALIAQRLGTGFSPIRKKGKLPAATESVTYSLEYGEDTIEIHKDAIEKGMSVLLVDDLLATGGTARASVDLVEKLGGTVAGLSFLIELDFLEGRKKLEGYDIMSVIHY